MTKIEKWKHFFKLFGIAGGITAGFFGLIVGFLLITGGFNPIVIELANMSFATTGDHVNYLSGKDGDGNATFVIDKDSELMILPNPNDATELEVTVTVTDGEGLIELPEVITIGTPFEVKIIKQTITVGDQQVEVNPSGIVKLLAEQGTNYVRCSIYVDVPVESYSLKAEKYQPLPNDEGEFFPGDKVYVSVDENTVFPQNAFATSNLSALTEIYKKIEFQAINPENTEIAKFIGVDVVNGKPKALFEILESGEFTVKAYLCKTFNAGVLILSTEEYNAKNFTQEQAQEYFDFINTIRVASEIEIVSQQIEIGEIASTGTTKVVDLHSTVNFTRSNLSIQLIPEQIVGSSYTAADLNYLINDIEIYGGYFVADNLDAKTFTINQDSGSSKELRYVQPSDDYLSVEKETDASNNAFWVVRVVGYKAGIEPANCLIIELPVTMVIQPVNPDDPVTYETVYYRTYTPVTINKNDVPEFMIKTLENKSDYQLTLMEFVGEEGEQTDVLNLNTAKLVLESDPTVELKDTDSTYKKVIYFAEPGQTAIETRSDGANSDIVSFDDLDGMVVPKNVGTTLIVAKVVRTDFYGNIIYDASGNYIIEKETATRNSLRVTVSRELIFDSVNAVLIVDEDGVELPEDSVEKDSNGNVRWAEIYIETDLYLKLNVNDNQSLLNAFENEYLKFIVITDSGEIIRIAERLALFTYGSDQYYVLQISAINSGSANLRIEYKGEIIFNISFTAQSYELQSIGITPNGTTVQAIFSTAPNVEWRVNPSDVLKFSATVNPTQAIVGNIDYYIFDFVEGEINPRTAPESTSIMTITGYANGSSGDIYRNTPIFSYKKAGKVIIVACAGEIYSNQVVIEVKVPDIEYSMEYGTFKQNITGVDYRKIITSYVPSTTVIDPLDPKTAMQRTSYLEFSDTECASENSLADGPSKIAVYYMIDDQPVFITDFVKFRIVGGERDYVKLDTATGHLLTSPVNERKYVQLEIYTDFGFPQTLLTYNYILIPDIYEETNYQLVTDREREVMAHSKYELFNISYDLASDRVVNNGGWIFITNSADTNYDKQIVYLPVNYSTNKIVNYGDYNALTSHVEFRYVLSITATNAKHEWKNDTDTFNLKGEVADTVITVYSEVGTFGYVVEYVLKIKPIFAITYMTYGDIGDGSNAMSVSPMEIDTITYGSVQFSSGKQIDMMQLVGITKIAESYPLGTNSIISDTVAQFQEVDINHSKTTLAVKSLDGSETYLTLSGATLTFTTGASLDTEILVKIYVEFFVEYNGLKSMYKGYYHLRVYP